ncbi:MAG: putative peptide modification system cyclase [Rudaea sp.]
MALRSPPAIAFAQRDWVVVGDLNNFTGKPILDESLENAFRLGLEQSQYVNVLSELKTRDTVALMQRYPVKTRIDRAIGSEVAIRAGARALILPAVAEVGGLVRVSAKVVDPKTQATVYTESVDGKDIQSVLPSIDKIDKNLRLRLGEALASISKQSRPLDQVATGNLDALRAYSLGQRAYVTGNMKDALAYYQDAVKLDPKFATAHLVIARVLLNADKNSDAHKQIELAAATPKRLSARDSLLVDAWQSTMTSSGSSLQKWKLLAGLYPDYYPANGPYSYFAWGDNRYTDAIDAVKHNVSPQNPNPSAGQNLLGILYLAEENYTDAAKFFRRAKESGFGRTDYAATVYAAQRDFRRANEIMGQNRSPGIKNIDLSTDIIRIALTVDQGNWPEAEKRLVETERQAEKLGPLRYQRLQVIALGLQSEFGQYDSKKIESYAQAIAAEKTDNAIDANQALFNRLFAIYLLAHNGDAKRAIHLLTDIGPSSSESDATPLNNLRTIVDAELARVSGHPQQAIESLKSIVKGNELLLTHRALLDAYASAGLREPALVEAHWLAQHRGRAYAEYGANQVMMAFNVAQSDLALLRAAELLRDLGRQGESAQALNKFKQAWPNISVPIIVARQQSFRQLP